MENKFIRICPKCGSIDITIPPAGMDLRMTMPDYCNKCSQRGIFPRIKISKVKDFREELSTRQEKNNNTKKNKN